MSNQPYTYLIGWRELDVWYYGARWSKDCNPNDLWSSYKTSSKEVKKFVELNGDPDVVQIRKLLKDESSVCEWENRVLKRLKVSSNTRWLNKTENFGPSTGSGAFHPRFGMKHSDEAKSKIRNTINQRILTKDQLDRLSAAGKKSKGRKLSEEAKANIARGAKERWYQRRMLKSRPSVCHTGALPLSYTRMWKWIRSSGISPAPCHVLDTVEIVPRKGRTVGHLKWCNRRDSNP